MTVLNDSKALPVTVMDFTGIYEQETFFRHSRFEWIDCRNVRGTTGFCDPEAFRTLAEKLRNSPAKGVHFLDSGNYHYVTELWLNKLNEPFNLAVFDHHTDTKRSRFGDLLSCGNWIRNSLTHNRNLRKVLLLGFSGERDTLPTDEPFRSRLICYDAAAVRRPDFLSELRRIHERLPLYISIDKDVLNPAILQTDWDQGDLTGGELKILLHRLLQTHRVLGVDVCGECRRSIGNFLARRSNDNFNRLLLEFLEHEHRDLPEKSVDAAEH